MPVEYDYCYFLFLFQLWAIGLFIVSDKKHFQLLLGVFGCHFHHLKGSSSILPCTFLLSMYQNEKLVIGEVIWVTMMEYAITEEKENFSSCNSNLEC